ncbi:MAG: UPF0280 family protein [Dehalococcoidales bacterium]|nr:MAG: UPF0280 family protein [Dehalococcoidales bacterium]
MYEPRFYRHWSIDKDLVSFNVTLKETDLYIRAKRDLQQEARDVVIRERATLESYIQHHPGFAVSMEPYPIEDEAPGIVREMTEAAEKVGVGPMAAVAGVIAERVGKELLAFSPEVIVENGGDIFLKSRKKRLVGVFAGKSPFADQLALEVRASETPLGICTSSGTVGHSLSLGKADAVIVLAPRTALADAAATAIGNIIKQADDIPRGIEFAQEVDGLRGVAIIKDNKMAVWGKIKIARR